MFKNSQNSEMNETRFAKMEAIWESKAVKSAYDATTNFNVGNREMVPRDKWFNSTFHFPIIAAKYDVQVVLYDVENMLTSLWTPGSEDVAYRYGTEKGLYPLRAYLGPLCIRLIYNSNHYQYLAPYSITDTN
mmetsp:Transcript_4012/g.5489  ORF Transcript_4012/g.5489 Transcript_4012/m.5489 type:complete len:132 (-) Transcript_4012:67-462(-)